MDPRPIDDRNGNGLPDDCEDLTDCNGNGEPDECESFDDCNGNAVPDECELDGNDCDTNGIPDVASPIVMATTSRTLAKWIAIPMAPLMTAGSPRL